jgi:hypothetical protein
MADHTMLPAGSLTLIEDGPRRRVYAFDTAEPIDIVRGSRFLGLQTELQPNDRLMFRCGPPRLRFCGVGMVSSVHHAGQVVVQVMAQLPIGDGDIA